MTYGHVTGMIAVMRELHPAAVELSKIETEYIKTLAKLATLKTARREKKRELRQEIINEIDKNPNVTHVDLGARFGVAEGTIRHIRRGLTTP